MSSPPYGLDCIRNSYYFHTENISVATTCYFLFFFIEFIDLWTQINLQLLANFLYLFHLCFLFYFRGKYVKITLQRERGDVFNSECNFVSQKCGEFILCRR